MTIYNFIAKCGVSCNCQIDITVETDTIDEAMDLAIMEAHEEFSNFSVELVED